LNSDTREGTHYTSDGAEARPPGVGERGALMQKQNSAGAPSFRFGTPRAGP